MKTQNTAEVSLRYAPIGTRIYFKEEKSPYRVRARSDRYLVCTKPFNLRKTTLYTIVDLQKNIRGTENLVFSMGAETDEDCVDMVKRLHGISEPMSEKDQRQVKGLPRNVRKLCKPHLMEPTQISHRNNIPLEISRVILP